MTFNLNNPQTLLDMYAHQHNIAVIGISGLNSNNLEFAFSLVDDFYAESIASGESRRYIGLHNDDQSFVITMVFDSLENLTYAEFVDSLWDSDGNLIQPKKPSKKRFRKRQRPKKRKSKKNVKTKLDASPDTPQSVLDYAESHFKAMHGDLEEITDELIDELVEAGKFPRHALIEAREMGMAYSRKRNSFWMAQYFYREWADDLNHLPIIYSFVACVV